MGKEANPLERFEEAVLYVITCTPVQGASGYAAMVTAACEGGADIVQFRDKILPWKQRYEVAAQLRKICVDHKTLFIVNDSVDLALAVQADGVHLGQDDLPLAAAQELVRRSGRRDFLIGKSTHSLEQAKQAEREWADYIGIGPVFKTPTKPTYEPIGLELVRQVTSHVRTPHVAIGGIDVNNVAFVQEAGARRVAVVRAACGASDILTATRRLKQTILEASSIHS